MNEQKKESLTRKLAQISQRIELLKQVKLDEKHTVTLTIFLPDFPNSNEIEFDTDQNLCDNLLQLTSCFLFLHLTNLEALKEEILKQLYESN